MDNVTMTSVDDLVLHPDNPRSGNVDAIAASIEQNGWYGVVVAQRSTRRVLAGNHRLLAARSIGVDTVPVYWLDVDDATASRVLLADNRLNDLATYNDEVLVDLLTRQVDDDNLLGTGYTQDDVDDLVAMLTVADDVGDQLDVGDGSASDSLFHNVDVFFNASPELGRICTSTGFRPGIISSAVSDSYLERARVLGLDIDFVDNEFKEYDHDKHIAAVRALSPKYATVRDVMTRSQCDDLGIDYYSLDDIIDMARDVNKYADNVMVIPKYDCIDDIPDEFMLGFSVPTSYGGTPLPIERFVGRRVHLLGGNWKRQRNALAVLGDSCVSLDNNHLMNIARFGQSYAPDGRHVLTKDVMPGYYGNLVAMLVSMSAIVADLSRAGCTVNGRRFLSKEDAADLGVDLIDSDRVVRGDPEGDDDE
jgi:hypothetical protein